MNKNYDVCFLGDAADAMEFAVRAVANKVDVYLYYIEEPSTSDMHTLSFGWYARVEEGKVELVMG